MIYNSGEVKIMKLNLVSFEMDSEIALNEVAGIQIKYQYICL